MSGFTLDFNDVYSGGLRDGQYEVIVTGAQETQTKNGTDYIEIVLAVRNDVQQESQNALIFHKLWKGKETGKYNVKMFNTIGAALNLQQGKQYNSLQDLLKDMVRKVALVTVKNEQSQDGQYNNVNVKSWRESKFPQVAHQFKSDGKSSLPIEITDDDLPF